MDTLTHALSGALVARATTRPYHHRGLSLSERTLAGFLAAAFPDLDYALYWLDPLDFLNWHRGPTHSLILLPLWAWLLAIILSRFIGNGHSGRTLYGICVLGVSVHILGDIITLYGTKLFSPLVDKSLGLGMVYDVDPYIAIIIGIGFIGSLLGRPGRAVGMTLMVLMAYLSLQAFFYWQTVNLGQDYKQQQGLEDVEIYALPQPLAPFMWKVIVFQKGRYKMAYVNYLGWEIPAVCENAWLPRRIVAAYRPTKDLHWQEYYRFGANEEAVSLARQVWQQDSLAAFRKFAVLPALYRMDHADEEVCVWFTDLRHTLPALPPPFRYGVCRTGPEADWQLYRLRYFTVDVRQLL